MPLWWQAMRKCLKFRPFTIINWRSPAWRRRRENHEKEDLGFGCFGGCFGIGRILPPEEQGKRGPIQDGEGVPGDLRATVTATGTVSAVTTVLVGTQVSGTVK